MPTIEREQLTNTEIWGVINSLKGPSECETLLSCTCIYMSWKREAVSNLGGNHIKPIGTHATHTARTRKQSSLQGFQATLFSFEVRPRDGVELGETKQLSSSSESYSNGVASVVVWGPFVIKIGYHCFSCPMPRRSII